MKPEVVAGHPAVVFDWVEAEALAALVERLGAIVSRVVPAPVPAAVEQLVRCLRAAAVGADVADARHGAGRIRAIGSSVGFVTLNTYATSRNLAPRTVSRWAGAGRLPGATMVGGLWLLPAASELDRPA